MLRKRKVFDISAEIPALRSERETFWGFSCRKFMAANLSTTVLVHKIPKKSGRAKRCFAPWVCWGAGICCDLKEGPWLLANYAGCSPQLRLLRLLMFWLTKAPPPFPLSSGSSLPLLFAFLYVLCKHGEESLSDFPFLFGGGWELVNSRSSYIQGQKWSNVAMFAPMFVHEQVMKAIDWKLLCSTCESKD